MEIFYARLGLCQASVLCSSSVASCGGRMSRPPELGAQGHRPPLEGRGARSLIDRACRVGAPRLWTLTRQGRSWVAPGRALSRRPIVLRQRATRRGRRMGWVSGATTGRVPTSADAKLWPATQCHTHPAVRCPQALGRQSERAYSLERCEATQRLLPRPQTTGPAAMRRAVYIQAPPAGTGPAGLEAHAVLALRGCARGGQAARRPAAPAVCYQLQTLAPSFTLTR